MIFQQFVPLFSKGLCPDCAFVTELKFKFIKPNECGGKGDLYVIGRKVGETEMPKMPITTYSLAETLDVGREAGTQVSGTYHGPFPLVGKLDRVVINFID